MVYLQTAIVDGFAIIAVMRNILKLTRLTLVLQSRSVALSLLQVSFAFRVLLTVNATREQLLAPSLTLDKMGSPI